MSGLRFEPGEFRIFLGQNPSLYIIRSVKNLHITAGVLGHIDKGQALTNEFIYKIFPQLYNLTLYTTTFLTGHDPFDVYLDRFKSAFSKLCESGEMRTESHAYFHSELAFKMPGISTRRLSP